MFSVYRVMCPMSSSACFCFGLALVCTVKLGASLCAPGVRQVLRTMVAISAIKVEKLCIGHSPPGINPQL